MAIASGLTLFIVPVVYAISDDVLRLPLRLRQIMIALPAVAIIASLPIGVPQIKGTIVAIAVLADVVILAVSLVRYRRMQRAAGDE